MKAIYQDIASDGLWRNNAGLVQLLGLCPLLAVSNSVVSALGLGIATLLVITAAALVISLLRHHIIGAIAVPVFLLIIATLVSCVDLLMQAYAYPLHQTLGIFVPLIVSNCLLLGRAESFASRNPPSIATFDGLMMGAGFLLLIVLLGAVRELLGTGGLFANLEQLLPFAANWQITLLPVEAPFLLALTPPGAFLLLGLLVAIKKVIDKQIAGKPQHAIVVVAGSKRVRVTGKL